MKSIFKLEKKMIHPSKWKKFYNIMPRECQEVVDGPPDALGIGYDEEYGWYILGCGQGPYMCWNEKGIYK